MPSPLSPDLRERVVAGGWPNVPSLGPHDAAVRSRTKARYATILAGVRLVAFVCLMLSQAERLMTRS